MRRLIAGITLSSTIAWSAPTLLGFCGFYCAKADTKLFNRASQVVLVRDADRTVMTMANDFRGDLTEFAVVIPVPTFLTREQIHIGDKGLIDHLDAYSAPRLVEYFDDNPCDVRSNAYRFTAPAASMQRSADAASTAHSRGVTIEAQYVVGEYDILILSAQQSSGLDAWLRDNGYRIPAGATSVLSSYLRQNMRFFVAKVNLTEHAKLGFSYLRPLQIAYESPKFMLPIRLGMVNADGAQELFVYTLTRRGRVETTNYRTAKLPSGMELPAYLQESGEFARFYKAMFNRQVAAEGGAVLFLEYAWDMTWCDPCAADPLSDDELRHLGVFWTDALRGTSGNGPALPSPTRPVIVTRANPDVFLTRLHVRYDSAHFPEDLVFQETADRTNFQGRYVVRHAWTGSDSCRAAVAYRQSLPGRWDQEAQRLRSLTGWEISMIRNEIRQRTGQAANPRAEPETLTWWERIWKK
jgi:hypothetical protein